MNCGPKASNGSYARGCRCVGCTAAHARYMADYRARGAQTAVQASIESRQIGIPRGERLDALCWCEAKMFRVPAAMIRAGRTESCGKDCHRGSKAA